MTTSRAAAPRSATRSRRPARRSTMAMRAAARAAARGDVRDLRVLPRGRRHRRRGRAGRREASRRSTNGGARSIAIYAGDRACRWRARCSPPMRRLQAAARGFPRHHRRHGDGCRARHPRARPRRARSLLRPGRERGRPAVGARFRRRSSARRSGRAGISAARCSSPTSCAISPRMPSAAGSICRANCWTKRGIAGDRRRTRCSITPACGACCDALAAIARRSISPRPGARWRNARAAAMRPAALMERGLSRACSTRSSGAAGSALAQPVKTVEAGQALARAAPRPDMTR